MISRLVAAALLCVASVTAPAKAQVVSPLYGSNSLIDQTVVTLDASGNATWNFTTVFPGVPAIVHLPKQSGTTDALICNWTSVSQTSVTIHCWRTNVLGALLSGVLGGATAGQQVSLVARYIP